ncbi:MAG: 3-isopropylmalate dehydrogenase [Geminicoccaceae bacterium]|nr:3-isopropylmalate dehydrogenase [Geminicoccaceae bacterium]
MARLGKLLLLPGDGIGPEVMAEVKKLLGWLAEHEGTTFAVEEDLVGGAALDAHGSPIADSTMEKAKAADAVIFGAVGATKHDANPFHLKPEQGLLRLRKDLGLFANLRPAMVFPALADASSLKPDLVDGLDILILRELTGGVYFGEPRGIEDLGDGRKRAIDTQVYTTTEIERIARVAFELSKKRAGRVTSVEKANVMHTGILWREVVTRVGRDEFPEVELSHMYADNCAMQLIRRPKQFDVIVTDNLFGDLLSDAAAMATGSLGMLPSASLGALGGGGRRKSLFEPVHGSAPDIAGQGKANPLAMLLSFAMALRYAFDQGGLADRVEAAIASVLDRGWRTPDIMQPGKRAATTAQMGDAVLAELG